MLAEKETKPAQPEWTEMIVFTTMKDETLRICVRQRVLY